MTQGGDRRPCHHSHHWSLHENHGCHHGHHKNNYYHWCPEYPERCPTHLSPPTYSSQVMRKFSSTSWRATLKCSKNYMRHAAAYRTISAIVPPSSEQLITTTGSVFKWCAGVVGSAFGRSRKGTHPSTVACEHLLPRLEMTVARSAVRRRRQPTARGRAGRVGGHDPVNYDPILAWRQRGFDVRETKGFKLFKWHSVRRGQASGETIALRQTE